MVKPISIFILILLLIPLSLMAAQVTAVADRDRIGAGESLQLELRVQGSAKGDPDLSPLEKDWDILSRSQSSQTQIINGHFSHAQVISLTLMPKHAGELEIPSVCFGSDCSIPLPIQVSQTATTPGSGGDELRLEAEASSAKALVGSQVLLTVRLLHRIDLAQASLSEPQPQGVDAEVQKLGKDRRYETHRDGYRYQAIERRYALFPHQAGTLHIPALQLDAQVPAPPSSFDPFGRSVKQVRRYSQAVDIKIEPIPGNLGKREWLPASSLTLEDDWQTHPPTLRVGEPATRTLTLRAAGLPAAHLPELELTVPTSWKSYPDQPSRSDDADANGVIGTLQQKIALVPTQPGKVELAAIDLDWYDTAARKWRRAHVAPLQVSVAPAAAGTAPVAPQPQAAAPPPMPEAAKSPASTVTPQTPPTVTTATSPARFWPWLCLFLALGWLFTLLFFWRQKRQYRSSSTDREEAERAKINREKDACKAILASARRNDPKATREALYAWSRCRWPESDHRDLELLAGRCGEPLAGELRKLGEVLYAKNAPAWQGAGLAEALSLYLQQKKGKKKQGNLPPLYPET